MWVRSATELGLICDMMGVGIISLSGGVVGWIIRCFAVVIGVIIGRW